MNYGFVIDNSSCIGCHACSTACKSENQVPVGVHRTWVRTTEVGLYPDVRRHFQVTRCNHCANPPCVRICPVTAMYQRTDGIVEFDSDTCIGCKACLQACPYDAIYIDPDSGTAAKCHYCGHRVENGLEPACVVVCPTHSIVAGDLDDPVSEIRRMIASQAVTVRKPEQGTIPNVFYVDGHEASLHPANSPTEPADMAFSEVQSRGGPIQVEPVRLAEQMVQVAWNAQHRVPWHWPVPAYLLTKAIAAGLWLWLALEILLPQLSGLSPQGHHDDLVVWAGGMSLLFTGITTGLLVWDLERPERFLSILTRPQWRSWLTRGAFILIAFSVLSTLLWVQAFSPSVGALFGMDRPGALFVQSGLAVAIVPLAVGTAVYTAFLFAQAEGRDLWQSPLLPLHLLIQTLTMGAGALVALGAFLPHVISHPPLVPFGVLLALDALVTLTGEFGVPHASDTAAEAAHQIRSGRWRHHFWWGGMVLGHALPLVLLWLSWANPGAGTAALDVVAFLTAAIGMFLYEVAFVMAPQQVPNS